VPSRPGIGFAEFENEMQSGMALGRVQVVASSCCAAPLWM